MDSLLTQLLNRLGWTTEQAEHFINCDECDPIGCNCCQSGCRQCPTSSYTLTAWGESEDAKVRRAQEDVARAAAYLKAKRERDEKLAPYRELLPE